MTIRSKRCGASGGSGKRRGGTDIFGIAPACHSWTEHASTLFQTDQAAKASTATATTDLAEAADCYCQTIASPIIMTTSSVISRESRRPSVAPTQRRPTVRISCNKCHKPLLTNLFVCTCNCVFCEGKNRIDLKYCPYSNESLIYALAVFPISLHVLARISTDCTHAHFGDTAKCQCGRMLQDSDFLELNVADPSLENPQRNLFQFLFTKSSAALQSLSYLDMTSQLFHQFEYLKAGTKFLVHQMVRDATQYMIRYQHVACQLQKAKQEITNLKRSFINAQNAYKQATADLQNKVTTLQKKLEEKDRQLMQFRSIHTSESPQRRGVANGFTESPHRSGAAKGYNVERGPRRVSGDLEPPMKGYLIQKQARERATQEALAQAHRGRGPLLGGNAHHRQMQPPASSSGHSHAALQHRGYSSDGSADASRHRARQGGDHINKRRRTHGVSYDSMSPSEAFGHGSQFPPTGPSTYFQQPSHQRR